jgi:hypothetical protein
MGAEGRFIMRSDSSDVSGASPSAELDLRGPVFCQKNIEYLAGEGSRITYNNQKKGHMKSILLSIACALAAPLAFAQVSTTTTQTTTTYATGTVSTYEPGKTIVVKSDEGPVSFALGTTARIVNGAGKILTAPLRAGEKVRVYYSGPVEHRTVERVVVED